MVFPRHRAQTNRKLGDHPPGSHHCTSPELTAEAKVEGDSTDRNKKVAEGFVHNWELQALATV